MSQEILKLQDAIYRLALAADSLVVNGVTMCLTQQDIAKGFLKDLVQKSLTALQELVQLIPRPNDAAEKWQPELQGQLKKMGDILVDLSEFKCLSQDRVDCRTRELTKEYLAFRHMIKSLELTFPVPRPFYESRPPESAKRLADFLQNLPDLFQGERTTPSKKGLQIQPVKS